MPLTDKRPEPLPKPRKVEEDSAPRDEPDAAPSGASDLARAGKEAEQPAAGTPAPTPAALVPDTLEYSFPGVSVEIREPANATPSQLVEASTRTENSAPPAPQGAEAMPQPPARKPAGLLGRMPPASIGPQSLRLAAARGNAAAQHEIATRFADGSGVERDLKQAHDWYVKAAAQGLAPAQYRLAAMYERGQGAGKDPGRARLWYERAAGQGHVKAMHNLAVMHTIATNGNKPDYVTAAKWFGEASRYGLTDSQFNLGVLYERGLGVPKDPLRSYQWFALAAMLGDKEAQKRRDQVRLKLTPQVVRSADRVLRQWRPKPADRAANEVRPPQGGWRAVTADAAPEAEADAAIAKAQRLLNGLGYDAGEPDGVAGPQTEAAVRSFESRSGLEPTGRIDETLIRRLEALAG